jgi:hypothetical protein
MVSWLSFSWIGFQPVSGLMRQAHEALGQLVGRHTPGELVPLIFSERFGGGIDVDETITGLDDEFSAGNVAQSAGRQAGPDLLPIRVFFVHVAQSVIVMTIVLDRFFGIDLISK